MRSGLSGLTRALLLLLLLLPLSRAAEARIVDRIAALVDHQVITLTEVEQVVALHLFARNAAESDEAYRRRVLDAMIAQSLRFRDVERFGAEDISKDAIEARLVEVRNRFPSPEAFSQTLTRNELTIEEVRSMIQRQLQVEAYIEERFSPLIFVSLDEIERYYREEWTTQRARRGLPPVALSDAQEEIRKILRAERLDSEVQRWTTQLRDRANVDVYALK